MSTRTLSNLRGALDFKASELWGLDSLLAVAGAVGGALIAVKLGPPADSAIGVVAGIVGVIIGAVLAGAAILAAFLDQAFLRKIAAVGREPVHFVAPFLFSATLGTLTCLALIVAAFTTPTAPSWFWGCLGGIGGFFTIYTVASLLPALDTLVQFLALRAEAASIPDDFDKRGRNDAGPLRPVIGHGTRER